MQRIVTAALATIAAFAQQPAFEALAERFRNPPGPLPQESISLASERQGVRVFDYSFVSPVEGKVPGLLVKPARRGRFPLILYGHWMMPGSAMRNRNEFLEEAVVMARAGAICLLLDSPLVRPGVRDDPDPMSGQGAKAALQTAREWRTAIDLMIVRHRAAPQRIAYVGHSFNAGVGAKLAGVEKRIQSFVLMANVYSLREFVYDEQNAEMKALREKYGEEQTQSYFRSFPWDDSLPFIQRSAPAAVFLQNGRADKPIPERVVRKSFAHFQKPKRLEFYDAGHELNAAARRDRVTWLEQRLRLRKVDFQALERIPPLR